MAIKVRHTMMKDVGTAFNVPHGSKVELEVEGGVYQNVQTFFNERDSGSIYEYVGLPAETPPNDVKELLLEIVRQQNNPEVSPEQVVKSSRLWSYIEHASNAASILEKLVSIANKGAEFIARMPLQ